jgi:hypothetical protein
MLANGQSILVAVPDQLLRGYDFQESINAIVARVIKVFKNKIRFFGPNKLETTIGQRHQGAQSAGLPDGLFSNQKSQIWVNFGGPLNGKCWYTL